MNSETIENFRLMLKPMLGVKAVMSAKEFEELFEMAQLGAKSLEILKAKPISDAPKDGRWLLGWEDGYLEGARPIAWNKKKKAWCDLPDGDRFESFVPTRFFPLSPWMKP